jgi:transposase InsO family protein
MCCTYYKVLPELSRNTHKNDAGYEAILAKPAKRLALSSASKGKPPQTIEWLTDNGSCYTAAETRSFAKQLGLNPVAIPVTSAQSNGMAERFVKTLKRDYSKPANRPDSKTVTAQLKDWFDEKTSYHPDILVTCRQRFSGRNDR